MTHPLLPPDPTPAAPRSLPLEQMLLHASAAVAAVRAGRSLDDALASVPSPARAGSQALAYHTLRWLGSAQAARARLVDRPPAPRVDALLCTALALAWPMADALYAPHVLVDQAVRCVQQINPRSTAFINAVLRRFLRERDTLAQSLAQTDPVAQWNHPRWWIDTLRHDWPQHWQRLLAAANQHPPMTLRVNAQRADAPTYQDQLAQVGLGSHVLGPHTLALAEPCPVSRLPGFERGWVSVQDEAAQLAAPLLLGQGLDRLADHAHVLDACAAPGGKTAHLLELARLDLVALDVDAQRLQRVAATLQRLGLSARLQAGDARRSGAWWDGRAFDAILLDAPCTASGIVRRHPDIRWLRRSTDVAALAGTQRELLDALWPLLKPGGRLIYATCSVFRAEGESQIEAFLQRNADAARHSAPGHLLPPDNPSHEAAVAPDGFFYARLDKTG